MTSLTDKLRARLAPPENLELAVSYHARLKPLHDKLLGLVAAAEVKGCSDEVRLTRVDSALAALHSVVDEK